MFETIVISALECYSSEMLRLDNCMSKNTCDGDEMCPSTKYLVHMRLVT